MSSLFLLINSCPNDPRVERENNRRAMLSVAILMLVAFVGLIMPMRAIDTVFNVVTQDLLRSLMAGSATYTSHP